MPKRAVETDAVDPVRSRLAGAVAGAVEEAETEPEARSVQANRESSPAPSPAAPRREESPQQARSTRVSLSSATVHRKFEVSEQEADRMQDVTLSVSKAFGGKVPHSKITRVLWSILADQEERLKRIRPERSRRVPSTGDAEGQAEYEVALYEFLSEFLTRGR